MPKDYSWMDKTKPGKRTSEYSPKREPVRKEKRGNIAEVIREKNQRTYKSGDN